MVMLLLFVPGSPAQIFSASVSENKVVVSETLDFSDGSLQALHAPAPGAVLATFVDSIDKLSDGTLRFNMHWSAIIDRTAAYQRC